MGACISLRRASSDVSSPGGPTPQARKTPAVLYGQPFREIYDLFHWIFECWGTHLLSTQ